MSDFVPSNLGLAMIPAMKHRFVRVLARVLAVVAGVGLALFMAYYSVVAVFSLIDWG